MSRVFDRPLRGGRDLVLKWIGVLLAILLVFPLHVHSITGHHHDPGEEAVACSGLHSSRVQLGATHDHLEDHLQACPLGHLLAPPSLLRVSLQAERFRNPTLRPRPCPGRRIPRGVKICGPPLLVG